MARIHCEADGPVSTGVAVQLGGVRRFTAVLRVTLQRLGRSAA